MDELDRLYRRVVQNVRAGFPELLTRSFEVSQLYQQIVPYRTNRRELGFDSNEEYELALMQLLAGLRGYLSGDGEMQKAMRQELASSNPNLAAFRVYATSSVTLAAEALRALERQPSVTEAPRSTPSTLSPSEQALIAGRATEAVDVSSTRGPAPSSTAARAPLSATAAPVAPAASAAPAAPAAPALSTASAAPARPVDVPPSQARGASAPIPAPRRDVPAPSADSPMTAPRPTAPLASVGDTCRYCGGGLPEGRRITFCPGCGHNLTVQHCPACATELEVGWKFCITCGRGVGG